MLRTMMLVLVLLAVSLSAEADDTFDPGRLEVAVLDSGIPRPMELEVAPDGRVFYIELDGKLKIFKPTEGRSVHAATINVFNGQENGLLGLALDPNFADNQWIYLQYSPPDEVGQRIARFTMKGDTLDMASEKILLRFSEQRLQCCHHAGSMRFGPNGNLFISTGDNTHPHGDSKGYAPIDERKDKFPWDAQKSSANTHDLRGKILRIRPLPDGTFAIPAGNLFPEDGSKGRPEIYVMGCRNPWRMDVDQKTGYVYWGEVGPDAGGDSPDRGPMGHDEINQARKAGNFGWPYFIADNKPYRDFDYATGKPGEFYDVNKPINESPNNTGSRILPPAQPAFIYYPGRATSLFPEVGSGGRTACAGPVYHFDESLESQVKFPKHFDNTLFIFEWSRHWIRAVHLDADSNIKKIAPFMDHLNLKRPVDITFGPEGAMYVLEYGETWGVNENSRLLKITYNRGNRTPIAQVSATGNVGKAPLSVAFSSEGSSDRDQDELTFEWRILPSDEVVSTEANPKLDFKNTGVFQVELTVKDPAGGKSSAIVPVMVGNSPPEVAFDYPQDGDFFEWGQTINYKLSVRDEEDGTNLATGLIEAKIVKDDPECEDPAGSMPVGFQLIRKSDCLNCHAVNHKIVGPAFADIAKKYNNDPKALSESAERVVKGSANLWSPVPMLPHPQHSIEEARQMVAWIFSLSGKGGPKVTPIATEKTVALPKAPSKLTNETVELVASYTDRGAVGVTPLSGSSRVRLRDRRVQVERSPEVNGVHVAGTSPKGYLGSIKDKANAKLGRMNLTQSKQAKIRYSSNGAGGEVYIRIHSPTGPIIAKFAAPKTGDWGKYQEVTSPVKPVDERAEVYVTFHNADGRDHLMNLDWIQFE